MKVEITVHFRGQEFEDDPSLVMRDIFEQISDKAMRQSYRAPGCVCTALEADDVVRDRLGRTIGTIRVTKEPGDAR